MGDLDFEQLTKKYLSHCKYERGLDSKTIKAYRIDLAQYAESSGDPNMLCTKPF